MKLSDVLEVVGGVCLVIAAFYWLMTFAALLGEFSGMLWHFFKGA